MNARPPLIPNCKEPRPTHAVRSLLSSAVGALGANPLHDVALAHSAAEDRPCGAAVRRRLHLLGAGRRSRPRSRVRRRLQRRAAARLLLSFTGSNIALRASPCHPPLQGCLRVAPRPALRQAKGPPLNGWILARVFRTGGARLWAGHLLGKPARHLAGLLSQMAGHVMPTEPCGLTRRLVHHTSTLSSTKKENLTPHTQLGGESLLSSAVGGLGTIFTTQESTSASMQRKTGPVAPPSGGGSTSWAQAGAAGPAA
eukprot:SM000051S17540  [mRNA]  locus=s51:145552:146440:- [translate_table: standard]